MGKAMDAIVVEEEGVAKEGIKYLKAQKCAPETFVPLDSIRVKAIPTAPPSVPEPTLGSARWRYGTRRSPSG